MAVKYVTPELKQYYLDLIERIRDAFRNRLQKLDWMSETSRKQRPCSLQTLDRNKRFFQLILADNGESQGRPYSWNLTIANSYYSREYNYIFPGMMLPSIPIAGYV